MYFRYFKDISLYASNSTEEGAYKPNEPHPGCFSNYRYFEGRQDFSVRSFSLPHLQVDNYARIQISYDGDANKVVVKIDPQNHGHYVDCLTETVALPEGWWDNAYIGISATTGDLADNHDLIEVSTMLGITETDSTLQAKEEEQLEAAREESLKNLLKSENLDPEQMNPKEMALFALVKELNDQQGEELQKLKRELEHSMTGNCVRSE